ncbi:MAG: PilZ domain-containing protein [Thermodesulfobacteriota bacterium]
MMIFRKKRTEKQPGSSDQGKTNDLRRQPQLLKPDAVLQNFREVSDYRIPAALKRLETTPVCQPNNISVFREKRSATRVATFLTGGYRTVEKGYRGLISIENMSRTGMRVKLNARRLLHINDRLIVTFNLDNIIHLPIQREVLIKHTDDIHLGVEFCGDELYDGLHLYLGDDFRGTHPFDEALN